MFITYYTDFAISTPSDQYFVEVLCSTWYVSENDEDRVFLDRVRHLVAMMRQRLISVSNNSQEEYVLGSIFTGFNLNKSGVIEFEEMAALLAKLGC